MFLDLRERFELSRFFKSLASRTGVEPGSPP